MSGHKKLLFWLPALIWMGVIFAFSAQSSIRASVVDWQDLIIRKFAHSFEYFILTILYLFALKNSLKISQKKAILVSIVLAILYAISDETHQLLVPGREGKIQDVLIDSIGVGLGGLLSHKLSHSI